jgi:hypothetical protein
LNNPKEEVLEVLPLIISKSILLAIEDKITEPLDSLVLRSSIPIEK